MSHRPQTSPSNHRPRTPQGPGMEMPLRAPYRFIPISRWVHTPDWAETVSHDQPVENGVSGWLDLNIIAQTPLMVGQARHQGDRDASAEVHFFTLPDGTRAIPGTTLRGAIRSIVEIAAFGRAAFIDERRYGVRDLQNGDIYGDRMTTGNGKSAPIRYLMKAGWLEGSRGSQARIVPCTWAKLHVTDLIRLSATAETDWEPRMNVPQRYAVWGNRPLRHQLPVEVEENEYPHSVGRIVYRRAGGTAANATRMRNGTIVLTGKPASGTLHEAKKKKFEFFFCDPDAAATPLEVAHLWKDFELIHEAQLGADAVSGNAAWPGYWKPRFRRGKRVPVFYLEEAGAIVSFGLASMFRLAYPMTTHDLLRHTHERHVDENVDDFATLLFGRAAEREADAPGGGSGSGLKGRVAFEPARQTSSHGPMPPVRAVLSSPKAQFYPAYVKQRASAGPMRTNRYASYGSTSDGSAEAHIARPELAGRKRFPVRSLPPEGPAPFGAGNANMQTVMHPLPEKAAFDGRVRFHNLRPEELGALVWALLLWAPSWGNRPALRHTLGMGKPYGFGAVEIALTGARIEANKPLPGGQRNLLTNGTNAVGAATAYADQFVDHMEKAWRTAVSSRINAGWSASEQIEKLLGLAQMPVHDETQELRYPSLAAKEFIAAKQDKQVLAAAPRRSIRAAAPSSLTDDDSFPRNGNAVASRPAPPERPTGLAAGTIVYVIAEAAEAVVLGPDKPGSTRIRYTNDGEEDVVPNAGLTPGRR
nr:TIGR03986 family CRISPR-associated RAMP protein [uncultured Rhodopila sp.]